MDFLDKEILTIKLCIKYRIEELLDNLTECSKGEVKILREYLSLEGSNEELREIYLSNPFIVNIYNSYINDIDKYYFGKTK